MSRAAMPEPCLAPVSEEEAAEIVRAAAAENRPLEIVGGGTRRDLGRPVQAERTLSSAGLSGITLYEPSELVISAKAGTPLREIAARLDEQGQMLAFEPPDPRVLLGSAGEPTIGGLVATGLSGPRRIALGAVRDHILGVRFVNGRGEIVKSGGRVMKNVTGYDLAKLQTGAYGTLGFVTEATLKVLPRPRATLTLLWRGLDDARAIACLSAALGSPYEASGAAHLPAAGPEPARTLVRLENFPSFLDYRAGRLSDELAEFGKPERIDGETGERLWADIRDVRPLAEPRARAIWRVSVASGRGPEVVRQVVRQVRAGFGGRAGGGKRGGAEDGLAWFYDWGGGLVWLALPASADAGAGLVRGAVAASGGSGHVTLIRADPSSRAAIDVFQPEPPAVAALSSRLKAVFDPAGVLNPGRMRSG